MDAETDLRQEKRGCRTLIKDGMDTINFQSLTFQFQVQLPMYTYVVRLPTVAFEPTTFVLQLVLVSLISTRIKSLVLNLTLCYNTGSKEKLNLSYLTCLFYHIAQKRNLLLSVSFYKILSLNQLYLADYITSTSKGTQDTKLT